MSNSVQPHGLKPTRLLHPWDLPGKSTGVGCHCPLQLEKVTGGYNGQLNHKLIQAIMLLALIPVLRSTFCPQLSQLEPLLEMQPRESNVWLRPSGWYATLGPVTASIPTFKSLTGGCGNLLLWFPKKSVMYNVLFIKPPASQTGVMRFFFQSLFTLHMQR